MGGECEEGKSPVGEIEKADPMIRLSILEAIILILGGMSNGGHLSTGRDQAPDGCILGDLIHLIDPRYLMG